MLYFLQNEAWYSLPRRFLYWFSIGRYKHLRIHPPDKTLFLPRKHSWEMYKPAEKTQERETLSSYKRADIKGQLLTWRALHLALSQRKRTRAHTHTIKHSPNFRSAAEARLARKARMARNRWNDSILPITRPCHLRVINPFPAVCFLVSARSDVMGNGWRRCGNRGINGREWKRRGRDVNRTQNLSALTAVRAPLESALNSNPPLTSRTHTHTNTLVVGSR